MRQKPVYLLGQGYGLSHSHVGEAIDLTTSGAVDSGHKAFATAGIKHSEIEFAQLYDCFTIAVIMELEDLGFCKKGEGGTIAIHCTLILGAHDAI